MKFLLDHDVPEDLRYLLEQLGHEVSLLRKALPENASDEAVLQFAHERGCVLLTCNRDDFLHLATEKPHTASLLSSGVERELPNGRLCFDSWSALGDRPPE